MQRIGRMTRSVVCATGVVAIGLLTAGPAGAQIMVGAWEDTGYVSINYGYQVGDRSFQESLTATVYEEEATYLVDHASSGGGHFDIGGGLRVWGNLAAGVAVTSFSTSAGAAITGLIPHPLFFGRPRTGTSARVDLEHKELGIHVQAAWVMPVDEKISVTVAAGPSFFNITQSLIRGVAMVNEIGAPFDTVALGTASTTSVSETGVGVNAGVDITYLVTERLGGGLFVRWAGGSVDLPASGGSQSIDVGGLQVGVGLRARF